MSSTIPIFQSLYLIPSGFHTKDHEASENILTKDKAPIKNMHRLHNLTTFLSWIPGLSIISGIANLHFAKKLDEHAKKSQSASKKDELETLANCYRARAIASFCQASIFLMIFDIITTVGRFAPCCQPED